MTNALTRMAEIQELEHFAVEFMHENNISIDPKTNGMGSIYTRFQRMMKGSATEDWKDQRFAVVYPGKRCIVMYANGTEAPGQTLLSTVRASYEEGAAEGGA
jgi:hypothetical protein